MTNSFTQSELFIALNQLGIFAYGIAFVVTIVGVWLLRPLALRLDLVDHPGGRKQHAGKVPLIGGIVMFVGFAFALLTLPISLAPFRSLIAGSALLVVIGVMDDFHELSARARLIAQVIAAAIIAIGGGTIIYSFGNLIFLGPINLGWFAIPVTIFAVVGIINAVNMTDGVDGLAASLCLIEMLLLALVALHAHDSIATIMLGTVIAALLAFLLFNFRFPGRQQAQIFMGDAGSMLLGFILAWFLIRLSQGPHPVERPVTMLWIMAVPLFDTTRLLMHRLLQRKSPFTPDRKHFHHLLMHYGFNSLQITIITSIIAFLFGMIGILATYFAISESYMFLSFVGLFLIYYWWVGYRWRTAAIRACA